MDAKSSLIEALETGKKHGRAGRYAEACTVLGSAVHEHPHSPELHTELAAQLNNSGSPAEAIRHYQHALALRDDSPEAWNNLGNILRRQGQVDQALIHFRRALDLHPEFDRALYNLGLLLSERGEYQEAQTAFRSLVLHHPDHYRGWSQRGFVLQKLERYDEAIDCFCQARDIRPDAPEVHFHLAGIYRSQGNMTQAIENYRQTIALRDDYVAAYASLADMLDREGQHKESIELYRKILTLDPENASAHFHLGVKLLRQGRYEEGWPHYHWRKKTHPENTQYLHPLPGPAWNYEPLTGKRLFVFCEQGMGDVFQMLRYLKVLKECGAFIIFESRAPIARLTAHYPYIDLHTVCDLVIPPQVDYDYHVSLLDLPMMLGTTLASLPPTDPLLKADPALCQKWAGRLDPQRFKIGIVWSGNPENPINAQRSLPLKHFASLAQLEGVQLVSLQHGEPTQQAKDLPWDLLDLGSQCQDFADTAAIIDQLDLVITICTSVSHLAGVMGRPVWVLLSHYPDWRWHLER
ncbi:tetratricopeptide repeat protein, partial [Planctomycetota bacterium]